MPLQLPHTPDGHQFEDFVAASLRALGYFIETRITLREDKKEVLELDVVATPAGESAARRELYEAKKAPPSFPILFKLFGQRTYLGIDSACLATLQDADAQTKPVYEAKGGDLGVRTCCHKIDLSTLGNLAEPRNTLTEDQRQTVASVAWFLQIAKRLAHASLRDMCKANSGVAPYDAIRDYGFQVQASFFAKTALDRAEALYSAYFENPHLTGRVVSLIAQSSNVTEQSVWNEVNDTDQRLALQSQMLTEWVSRTAIIKHALDHVVEHRGEPLPTLELRIGGQTVEIAMHNVPPRFVEGLKTLHAHPYSLRLPYLFQTFLELCGGFLVTDSDDDLAMIESVTGVPRDQVVPALKLIDEFFAPAQRSMFFETKHKLLCCKMVPGFARGIGSFLRYKYMNLTHYDDKFPKCGWLMARWHLAGYKVLATELPEVPVTPAT